VQISAPSASTAWALVDSRYLFRSLDGGRTWVQRTFPTDAPGAEASISFVDEFHGYALFPGQPATQCTQAGASVYATSDGAATWDLVAIVKNANRAPQGLPFERCKVYVYFLDQHWGFVAGHDALRPPVISTTQDGGRTWTESTIADRPLRVTQIRNFVTLMLLAAVGVDGNGQPRSFVYDSNDGGLTWSFVAAAPLNLEFVTSTRWLTSGADGSVMQTDDRGGTWTARSDRFAKAGGVAPGLVFPTPDTGYAIVSGGVYRTTDAGAHWELIKSTWP
jgi:photosystem II stability/assembly factor-like uncharacterized protein